MVIFDIPRIPYIVSTPNLTPILLQNPEFLVSNDANPVSGKIYWGPSTHYIIICTGNTPKGKLIIIFCLILVLVLNGILLLSAISIIIFPDAPYSSLFRDLNCGTSAIEARGLRSRLFR